jgi:hypothetical protein
MKITIALIYMMAVGFICGLAQNVSVESRLEYDFVFYRDTTCLVSDVNAKIKTLPHLERQELKIIPTSNYFTFSEMPPEVLNSIQLSLGMVFYSAIRFSDGDDWLFAERNLESDSYTLCTYNVKTGEKRILFSEKSSPDTNFAFKPAAWSKSSNLVYLEALIYGSPVENDGIWSYDLNNGKNDKIPITEDYLSTPLISPDGNFLIYIATDGSKKEIHSAGTALYLYDLQQKKEKLIEKDNHHFYSIVGWVKKDLSK